MPFRVGTRVVAMGTTGGSGLWRPGCTGTVMRHPAVRGRPNLAYVLFDANAGVASHGEVPDAWWVYNRELVYERTRRPPSWVNDHIVARKPKKPYDIATVAKKVADKIRAKTCQTSAST